MSQIDIIDELKGIAQYLGDNDMTTCLRVVNRAIKEIQDGRDYLVEEVNRIKSELQKTLNAGAVWETACIEAEQENAKLRESLDEVQTARRRGDEIVGMQQIALDKARRMLRRINRAYQCGDGVGIFITLTADAHEDLIDAIGGGGDDE